MADWILDGEPEFDLGECDADRYGDWASLDYALEKCRETYGTNNIVRYPHENLPAGRPTKRTSPVYEELLRNGAFMNFNSGWEVAEWFHEEGMSNPEYKVSPVYWLIIVTPTDFGLNTGQ